MATSTEVAISGASVPRLPRRDLEGFVRLAMRQLRKAGAVPTPVSEISIAFVDDRVMRRLNREFRNRPTTTDVLTFDFDPADASPGASGHPLGEIVISVEQARRQARRERHSLATEVRYLVLHGLIHALGFDHETDSGQMDELETAVRRRLGLD